MKTDRIMIKMVLDRWYSLIKTCDTILVSITDEQLQKEIVPNKNRGIYLLGHLTAVHDRMLPILGFGNALHPELYNVFVENPDRAVTDIPSTGDLRLYWKEVNAKLGEHFKKLTPGEWFQKHNSVSEDDFKKEPHRNKLNLIINRTNHLVSHFGQLIFLSNKEE